MEQNFKLFKILYDCFINDEDGNEIKVAKGRNYQFKFGNFNNGGWPMIYIPEKNKWYDFCMYDDGTAEWDEKAEQIAECIPKEQWTGIQVAKYNTLLKEI